MPLPNDPWSPSAALLAAYFDGELRGSHGQEALRRRIERWLRDHPDGPAEIADQRLLAALWHRTTPPDPGPAAWRRLEQLLHEAAPRRPVQAHFLKRGYAAAIILATAASLGFVVWYLGRIDDTSIGNGKLPPREDREVVAEVLPVATAAEVTILGVDGADTHTLVVGALPVDGPLLLAGPDDVAFTSVQPDARDHMLPHVRAGGPDRPLIWAQADDTAP